MFQQVSDFLDESEDLCDLLCSLCDADFEQQTLFKSWTINDVVGHLHVGNLAADLALTDPDAFQAFLAGAAASIRQGQLRKFERDWLDGLEGCALRDSWRDFYRDMGQHFGRANPKARMPWVGPDMSVRSGITARQMETWAHGQEIYDLLGVERVDADRIKNIVVLGVNTIGWTFKNRGMPVPETPPQLRLTAPSGNIWTFNEPNETDCIAGNATEFCQVVTQVRNVVDTNLSVTGETATQWMAIAQCFAGSPEDPPVPGSRYKNGR